MPTQHRTQSFEDEESYFVSMTDLMVGLLFVFIIMLMFFALQFRDATKKQEGVIDKITNAELVRNDILDNLERLLKERGIKVEIVHDQGILRLRDDILFDKGIADVKQSGIDAIRKVGEALDIILPCYTRGPRSKPDDACPGRRAIVEAIFIEGHTDTDPLTPRPGMIDNLDLSAMRATNTYRALIMADRAVLDFHNTRATPILSVSGYGEYRPVIAVQPTENEKQKNRRIDLRILMTAPRSEDARALQRGVTEQLDAP